jgi:hypothetical protein
MTRSERRHSLRKVCDLPTACVVISLVEPVLLPVRIRNISPSGIGLLIASRIAPGSFVAIKVQGPHQKAPRILRARIVHATFQPANRTWLIGGTFVEELGPDDLALLA